MTQTGNQGPWWLGKIHTDGDGYPLRQPTKSQARRLLAEHADLLAALRGLLDCEALEMYGRDDNPEWDAPEIAAARSAIAKAES